MVELLVVMLVLAIIGALAIASVTSARKTGQRSAAVSAAQAYADAVDRFALDHDGRFPKPPGTEDWPDRTKATGPVAGPASGGRTYMRRAPEAMESGNLILNHPQGTAAGVDYEQADAGSGYRITVRIPDRPTCVVIGGSATAGDMPECGKR